MLTLVNVCNDDFGTFICKQPRGFGANALATACDDGDLTGQHALGVVEMAGDLGDTI
jgi:hypothetical protein